jgi:hypothetical protein
VGGFKSFYMAVLMRKIFWYPRSAVTRSSLAFKLFIVVS